MEKLKYTIFIFTHFVMLSIGSGVKLFNELFVSPYIYIPSLLLLRDFLVQAIDGRTKTLCGQCKSEA